MKSKKEVIEIAKRIVEVLESLPHQIYEIDEELRPYVDNDVIYCANDIRYWAETFENAIEQLSNDESYESDEYDEEISETLRLAGIKDN